MGNKCNNSFSLDNLTVLDLIEYFVATSPARVMSLF